MSTTTEAGPALDALIHRRIFGKCPHSKVTPASVSGYYTLDCAECGEENVGGPNGLFDPIPAYSKCVWAAWRMEGMIVRRDQEDPGSQVGWRYTNALAQLVTGCNAEGCDLDQILRLVHASPEHRCLAALEAVR